MSDRKVELSIAQLRKILAWGEKHGNDDACVRIVVSHASGIGPSVEATMETDSNEGVWKDFTELEKW